MACSGVAAAATRALVGGSAVAEPLAVAGLVTRTLSEPSMEKHQLLAAQCGAPPKLCKEGKLMRNQTCHSRLNAHAIGSNPAAAASDAAVAPAAPKVSPMQASHQNHNQGKKFFMPKPAAVIGHRGLGSNLGPTNFKTLDGYFAGGVRENTMLAFNTAAAHGADFVELDVQVTKDGTPVIWHDDYIHYMHLGSEEIISKKIRELTIAEFKQLSYMSTVCPKKPVVLMRKFDKKEFKPWVCRQEDQLPTLEEVLRDLPLSIGINLELKFEDDHTVIEEEELRSRISSMMKCIELHSNRRRRIVLSSFSPDACIIVSAMNTIYPVMMLTDAGYYKYPDERRNSIRAAHQLAKNHDLLGVVTYSYVLPDKDLLEDFERDGLHFMSYGERNNDGNFSVEQIEMGIYGLIVDDVRGVHNTITRHLLSAN